MNDSTIRRAAALFAAAVLAAPAAAWADGEKGQGEERSASAPGQVKPAGEPAAPPQREARAKGGERSAAGAQARGRSGSAPHGNAYGHDKQAAKGTAKPAPPRGSKPVPSAGKAGTEHGMAHRKTTLCHATGSETNPYVTITISDAAVQAHARHQDERDVIPAPAEGCPGGTAAALARARGETLGGAEETAAPADQGTFPGTGDVLGEARTGTAPAPAPQGERPAGEGRSGVLGEFADRESGAAPGTGAAGEATDREAGADSASATLPFTGLDLGVVLVAGLALLLAGITAKRVAAIRS